MKINMCYLLGPGAYKPEETGPMKSVFQSPPAYTFGTRHKYYGLDNTPGNWFRIYFLFLFFLKN